MKIVIQRVSEASVSIDKEVVSSIATGLVILLGIADEDAQEDIEWLCRKVIGMRIFTDKNGVMNKSIQEIEGDIIVVSQFTLYASTKKGNRPSYIKAAKPEIAVTLYEDFKKRIESYLGKSIQSGKFGADMKVALTNDGPVTIIVDSKNRI